MAIAGEPWMLADIRNGPYRFIRHPVYAGYLALLLGSGVASLNICLWLLWPVSLIVHKKGVWNPTSCAKNVESAQAQGSRHLFCAKPASLLSKAIRFV